MKRILFQGDSITDAGRCLLDVEWYVGQSYATMISGRLGHDKPGEYEFVNRGIAGNRVVDLYARVKRDILNIKPDILSILIGINDVWHDVDENQNGVDAEKYAMVYDLLIQEIKTAFPDIQIMLLEPFVLKGSNTEEHWDYFQKEVPVRAASVKALCEKYDLVFVPLQDKFNEAEKHAPAEYWLRDGVHPTPMGNEIIAREWMKAFEKIQEV
ncbi:MAG: SGNH/GDSL hydrolase family protein [Clostridia bacterium]|nr:SGNH/GDSL hydrolase family protein [Clostridia bacterium]